jgi:uncharacterized membrane protein YphA (DoxX/SURF4 family)
MRLIVTWIVTILLALAFLGAGVTKLMGLSMMVSEFGILGYPLWFMYLTGSLEIVAAVLVVLPRFAALGAALIVCIMVGALYSHLTHGQAAMIGAPVVLLILAITLGTLRSWNLAARHAPASSS